MSDSDSDTPQPMQELNFKLPRRKKLRKRLPSHRLRRYDEVHNQKCCHSYGRLMSLSFIIIILCCWLLILSWLIVIFNDELKRFDGNIMAIITGNQGIPESLQKCHLQTKELQRNQTDLYSRFVGLNATVINLTYEVSSISSELKLIQDKLKSFSELTDVPVTLKEHFQSISTLQNWIDEFNDTVTQLKASENHFEEEFEEFQLNLTSFKERLTSLEKVPKVNASAVNDEKSNSDLQKLTLLVNKLNENVTYLNNSLTNEIELLQNKPFQDPAVFENLLNQNISTRLSTLETEFYNVSNNVKNLTRQIDENIKLKFANNETK